LVAKSFAKDVKVAKTAKMRPSAAFKTKKVPQAKPTKPSSRRPRTSRVAANLVLLLWEKGAERTKIMERTEPTMTPIEGEKNAVEEWRTSFRRRRHTVYSC
jgi:hypothetical protein